MKLSPIRNLSDKALVVFDLDGTLAESKSKIDAEMAALIRDLLHVRKVAVISGGRYEQFQKQLIAGLKGLRANLKNLFMFPTTANAMYRYRGAWKAVYKKTLSEKKKEKIFAALQKAFCDTGYVKPKKVWGETIEDRGTQITFSMLGQHAPVLEKKKWNRNDTRPRLIKAIKKYIPEFEVRSGGLTSIDITKKGIDKAYGIGQIEKHLKISKREMVFIGDALHPGGNDHPVIRTGVDCVAVKDPRETKKIIRNLIATG